MKKYVALLLLSAAPAAMAQAPADAAQARAKEEAAAKAAWAGKVANFQLCQSQERVAERYFAEAKTAGKPTAEPVPTPECADPGPFSFLAPDEKPLEVSGAHSPAPTAATPPSTNDPASEKQPPQSSEGTGSANKEAAAPAPAGGQAPAATGQAPAAGGAPAQSGETAVPQQQPPSAPGGERPAVAPSASGHDANTPTSPGTASAPSAQ